MSETTKDQPQPIPVDLEAKIREANAVWHKRGFIPYQAWVAVLRHLGVTQF